jgi:hypothetical protein
MSRLRFVILFFVVLTAVVVVNASTDTMDAAMDTMDTATDIIDASTDIMGGSSSPDDGTARKVVLEEGTHPPPPVRPKPIFDRIFEPLLGDLGTLKFVEETVNTVGGNLNFGFDFLHDTDHGVRICNQEAGRHDQGVCYSAGQCSRHGGVPVGRCSLATPPTIMTTCCKFERTCAEEFMSQETAETVTYFKVNAHCPPCFKNFCHLYKNYSMNLCVFMGYMLLGG